MSVFTLSTEYHNNTFTNSVKKMHLQTQHTVFPETYFPASFIYLSCLYVSVLTGEQDQYVSRNER